MKIRAIEKADKEKILQAFKPILQGWDYLPDIIDSWFADTTKLVTQVACAEDDEFVAMIQIEEFAPKRWFSRGLRANPRADRMLVGKAIVRLIAELEKIMHQRNAISVSYRTLETFKESINLAGKNGFHDKMRFAHKWHDLDGLQVSNHAEFEDFTLDFDISDFVEFLRKNQTFQDVQEHFFTWHEIRVLNLEDVQKAKERRLAFVQKSQDEITSVALFYHVPEIKYLFLSIIEGDNEFIRKAFNFGVQKARELHCVKVGMIHPNVEELSRRQKILGLEKGHVHSILFHKQYRSEA